jgi:hypothetical protein
MSVHGANRTNGADLAMSAIPGGRKWLAGGQTDANDPEPTSARFEQLVKNV